MTFEIVSKYNIGDIIRTKDRCFVTVMDIRMRYVNRVVTIEYLVEYENRERLWREEDSLLENREEHNGTI